LCKTLLPLKLLVDADDWPFFGKTKLIIYIFCPPPVQKTFPRHWYLAIAANSCEFRIRSIFVPTF